MSKITDRDRQEGAGVPLKSWEKTELHGSASGFGSCYRFCLRLDRKFILEPSHYPVVLQVLWLHSVISFTPLPLVLQSTCNGNG